MTVLCNFPLEAKNFIYRAAQADLGGCFFPLSFLLNGVEGLILREWRARSPEMEKLGTVHSGKGPLFDRTQCR